MDANGMEGGCGRVSVRACILAGALCFMMNHVSLKVRSRRKFFINYSYNKNKA
jgi:hypothetical protein